jgi:hypothetical protein
MTGYCSLPLRSSNHGYKVSCFFHTSSKVHALFPHPNVHVLWEGELGFALECDLPSTRV